MNTLWCADTISNRNAHKMFLTIQGLLNLQRHWIRNDQSRNDYRGVSISAGGKIKSREKIILKIFFVNLSLLLECTYFMDLTDELHVSKVISDLILKRSGGFYELCCFCYSFPSFLESWKRVKQCFALTDYGFQLSGWILLHEEQKKDNNAAAQTVCAHWRFQQIFTASYYCAGCIGRRREFPLAFYFLSPSSNTCFTVIPPSSSKFWTSFVQHKFNCVR